MSPLNRFSVALYFLISIIDGPVSLLVSLRECKKELCLIFTMYIIVQSIRRLRVKNWKMKFNLVSNLATGHAESVRGGCLLLTIFADW